MSTLDELTGELDAACMAALGDPIAYTRSGGTALSIRAHVYYDDMQREVGGRSVIEQDIACSVLMTSLPGKPLQADRITLPRKPGKTYRPVNVGTDRSGTHWEFALQEVVANG